MKNRKLETCMFFLFCGLFVAAGIFFLVLVGKTYREYTNIKTREAQYEERLAKKELKLKEKEEMLHRLRHDPVFVERVIRQRLGYARADEIVFRFEETEGAREPPAPGLQ